MTRSVLAVVVALAVVAAAWAQVKKTEVKPVEVKAPSKGTGNFVHVVLFTMKKDTPATAIDEVIKDCHDMLAKISAVRTVKAGRPADRATPAVARKNYDLALLVLVDDADGLKAYLEDPKHLAFVKKHGKLFDMEKLRVFDFADQKK
jgi:hypothetical protein